MTREDMLRHAGAWIAAWNARDLAAVMRPFHDDARFTSPRAVAVTGSAVVEGRAAIEAYWAAALARIHTLEFRLAYALCDEARRELVVVYDRDIDGETGRACEFMRFDAAGRQIAGEAMYGASF
jgi:steroid delta-isomerase